MSKRLITIGNVFFRRRFTTRRASAVATGGFVGLAPQTAMFLSKCKTFVL